MTHLSNTSTRYRSWLLAGAALATVSTGAMAQSEPSSGVETVVVTGSLIQRTMADTPTPTVIVDADAIAKTGLPNIGAVLAKLPQIQNAAGAGDLTPTNSNFLTSGFGVTNVDLRELGVARTLVLVDGKRWVTGSPTTSGVDLNTIPTAMIDHVDVITGGASATYGSDAIAGVVNITLKNDFEGITANAQYGQTNRNDGADATGNVVVGGNFLEGKGNVTVAFTYDKQERISSGNRDITSTDVTQFPGNFIGYGTYSSFAPQGRFQYTNDSRTALAEVKIGDPTTIASLGYGIRGDDVYHNFSTATDGFDRSPNRYIQVPVLRRNITTNGHIDVAPWARFTFQGTYALTTSSKQLEPYPGASTDGLSTPTSAGGTGIVIPLTNPFYQDALTHGFPTPTAACGNLAALDPMPSTPPVACTGANAPTGLLFSRRFLDLGERTGQVSRNTGRIALGLDGDFGAWKNGTFLEDWKWNASYVWGRTEESQSNGGYYDKIKLQNALTTHIQGNGRTVTELDADGNPFTVPQADLPNAPFVTVGGLNYVCDDPVAQAAGCVPINLFGAGSITGPAANYVGSLITLQDQATEEVVTLGANGTVFTLPAGAVKTAIGYEYRREGADFVPDAASQAGTVAGNQVPATRGHFAVREVYGELLVPLLKDLPFVEYAEFDGAIRHARYSTAGDATSWKLGGLWQVNSDLKFRVADSSATRAPNIAELFTPNAQTFPGISSDPCKGWAGLDPSSNIYQNCQAQINSLGAPPAGANTNPNPTQAQRQAVGGYTSGNPNLKPETAYTLTAGLVYTPSWLPSFQATIDYYDIRVHGYIAGLSPDTTMQACYAADPAQFANNVFCQQIFRQYTVAEGPIVQQINFPTFNLGSIKTSGVDTTLTYAFDLGDFDDGLRNAGAFNISLNTTYISHYDTDAGVAGVDVIKSGGDAGLQHWRGLLRTTYTNGGLDVTTSVRWIGPAYVSKENVQPLGDYFLEGNHIPSVWYLDLNVSYDVTEMFQVYAGANNLFDNRPPETYPGSGLDTTGTGTIAEVYDPIGLFGYVGVNLKM